MLETNVLILTLCVLVGFLIVAVVVLYVMFKDLSADLKYAQKGLLEKATDWQLDFVKDDVKRVRSEFDALTAHMGIVIDKEPSKYKIKTLID